MCLCLLLYYFSDFSRRALYSLHEELSVLVPGKLLQIHDMQIPFSDCGNIKKFPVVHFISGCQTGSKLELAHSFFLALGSINPFQKKFLYAIKLYKHSHQQMENILPYFDVFLIDRVEILSGLSPLPSACVSVFPSLKKLRVLVIMQTRGSKT